MTTTRVRTIRWRIGRIRLLVFGRRLFSAFGFRHHHQRENAAAGFGAAAVQGIHVLAKPPVYAVVDIDQITDPEGFKVVGQRSNEAAAAAFKELGGRYIIRTDKITSLAGTPPKRFMSLPSTAWRKHKPGPIYRPRKQFLKSPPNQRNSVGSSLRAYRNSSGHLPSFRKIEAARVGGLFQLGGRVQSQLLSC